MTAWDISTAIPPFTVQSFSVAAQDTAPQGIFFRADGLKMYIVGSNSDSIWQYTLPSDFTFKPVLIII